jgi:SAM-dependent methyltransferase
VGDARRVNLADATVDACVSNLPFGHRYAVQGDTDAWLREVLAEMARLTRPGGRVVVLVPRVPDRVLPPTLLPTSAHPLRLLGRPTTLWCFDRLVTGGGPGGLGGRGFTE